MRVGPRDPPAQQIEPVRRIGKQRRNLVEFSQIKPFKRAVHIARYRLNKARHHVIAAVTGGVELGQRLFHPCADFVADGVLHIRETIEPQLARQPDDGGR